MIAVMICYMFLLLLQQSFGSKDYTGLDLSQPVLFNHAPGPDLNVPNQYQLIPVWMKVTHSITTYTSIIPNETKKKQ